MAKVISPGREQWSSRLGFIVAAIGSAVGLGNIWRFPGVAYENGGGAFLIPYLVALLTAGIPILFLDYALGHRFRGTPPLAFRRLKRSAEGLGWFQTAICFVIVLYYAVIVGWALSYAVFSVNLAWGDDPAGFFIGDYVQVAEPGATLDFVPGVLIPLIIIWVVAIALIALGIQRGVQRANLIFLPLLVGLFLIMVIRSLFLDGALDGLNAFFTPNWAALTDAGVWIAAYSQVFFSLSIAFGIMITYSSYLKRRSNLTSSGLVVGFANSSFEVLAGIGVFAALGFMAAQSGTTVAELEGITGVSLSFIAFPQIISMMPGGPLFGVLFFSCLTLAGFTSMLSILQVVSGSVQDKFGLRPRTAALVMGIPAAILSIVLFSTTSGLNVLDTVDKFANEIGIVASAIAMTILVAWVVRRLPELRDHLDRVSSFKVGIVWRVLVAVLVPLVLIWMLVSTITALVTEGYGGMPPWFTNVFGWGTIALLVVVAVVMPFVHWSRDVDDFDPDIDAATPDSPEARTAQAPSAQGEK
ncbi:sodium-dependent transporter [Okibacterium endophyticum]